MLILSAHATRQCVRRGITLAEISEAVASPSATYRSRVAPMEKLVILGATASGRRLKVVVLAHDNAFVVTVADRDQEG